MRRFIRQTAIACVMIAGFTCSCSGQIVLWAGRVQGSSGTGPESILGQPDGHLTTLGGPYTLSTFQGRAYPGLSTLIPYEELSRADIVAFEANGGTPGESGGWESSHWVFSDGVTSFNVDFDATRWPHGYVTPPGRPGVVSTGSFVGVASPYTRFFGFPDVPGATVWSYVLIALPPTLNKLSSSFTIHVSGGLPGEGEGSPDPDAIGLITCVAPSVTAASAKAASSYTEGSCPASVSFTGKIAMDGPGTVLYRWERSDGGVGPVQNLDFSIAGTQSVRTTWTLGPPSYSGWVSLRIVSPNPALSRPAEFSIRCTNP